MLLRNKDVKNFKKSKKGITLIEAIISVALLSILILPASALVMNSFKTSKQSELRQNAAYIGQKTLEELKSYDRIVLDDKKSFTMLNTKEIVLDEDGKLKGSYYSEELKNKFNVDVTMEKNDKFINDPKEIIDLEFTINEHDQQLNSKSRYIKIVVQSDKEIKVYEKDTLENLKELYSINKKDNKNNNVLINIDKKINKDNLIIDVENESDKLSTAFINGHIKTNDLNIKTLLGKVIIKSYDDITKVGDLYDIKVKVLKDGEELFSGKTSSNIMIENK